MATLGTANVYSCTNLATGYTSTATAAGTTTLNSASSYQQYFTGTTTQTVRLPIVTSLVNGQSYQIVNLSTGVVSVQTSVGTAITTVSASSSTTFTCGNNASNVPASWVFGTTSSTVTLAGDVTGAASTNTVGKINTQPISASGSSFSIFWGHTGSVPTTTRSIGIGYQALNVCTAASATVGPNISVAFGANVGVGYQSLAACTSGGANTGYGYQTLQSITTQTGHTAVGYQASRFLTATNVTSALGYQALGSSTTGGFNFAVGHQALFTNTTGTGNCAFGYQSLNKSLSDWAFTANSQHTAFGELSMTNMNLASVHTAFGYAALGGNNTASPQFSVAFGSVSANLTSVAHKTTIVGATNSYTGTSSYNIGTVGTGGVSSTTVTGVGTRWNTSWSVFNSFIQFADLSTATVTAINSPTTLTVSPAVTQANGQAYTLFLYDVPTATFVGSILKTGSYSVGTASQSALAVTGTSTQWEVQPETWINYSSGGANMPIRTTSINSPTSITAQRQAAMASTTYTLTYGAQYYSVNTASQSGTTVTGTGTSFTPSMVDATLTFLGSFYANYGAVSQTGTTITATGSSPMFTASMAPGYIVYFDNYTFTNSASQTGTIVTSSLAVFTPSAAGNYILWGLSPSTEVSYITEYISSTVVRVAESRTLSSPNIIYCTNTLGSALVTAFVNSTTLTSAAVSSQTISLKSFILFYNNGAPRKITAYNSPTSLTVDTSQTIASCTYIIQDGTGKITGCNNTMIGGHSTSFSVPTQTVDSRDAGYVILSDTIGTPKLTITPNVCHSLNLPNTINSATYTHLFTDSSLVFTTTNSTITLLAPGSFIGAMLHLTNITANSVVSASSNVIPMASTTAGTAILAATAGRYALLQSDGTNWNVIMSN